MKRKLILLVLVLPIAAFLYHPPTAALDVLYKRADRGDKIAFAVLRGHAASGDVRAQVLVGRLETCALMGGPVCKVPYNSEDAAYWFMKAADQGDAEAQFSAGASMEDTAAGIELMKKSGEQGFRLGPIELCDFYFYGRHVKKDLAEAYYWCSLEAAEYHGKLDRPDLQQLPQLLDAEQKAAGDKRIQEWIKAHPDLAVSPPLPALTK